jgi:guanosine-3',5'-bis(diphosphate) 3'-pyrophosphohydrolase
MFALHDPKVQLAKRFAFNAHKGQTYGDEFPYIIHLQAVESVMLRFGIYNTEYLCGAWLHDTLEDTQATYEELASFFGEAVAENVAAVTEPKGGNRKSRYEQTYPRIKARGIPAVIIKLADRIANVETSGKKVGMYRKEHAEFKHWVYIKDIPATQQGGELGTIKAMQEHLDNLLVQV